jgi:hypothetical protein
MMTNNEPINYASMSWEDVKSMPYQSKWVLKHLFAPKVEVKIDLFI